MSNLATSCEGLNLSSPSGTISTQRSSAKANQISKTDLSDIYTGFTPDNSHIAVFMLLIALTGTVNGYGLSYTNNTMPVINALYGWDTAQTRTLNDSLIGCAFSFGAGIGASTGGRIIRSGRRRALIMSCCVGILGCALQCLRFETALIFGRVIYGYSAGLIATSANRMVDEYVPLKVYNKVTPIFSFCINLGSSIAAFTAVVLPADDASTLVLSENTSWRYIYAFPILLYLLVLAGLMIFVKTDTPKFYLLRGDRHMAATSVKNIYKTADEAEVQLILDFIGRNS